MLGEFAAGIVCRKEATHNWSWCTTRAAHQHVRYHCPTAIVYLPNHRMCLAIVPSLLNQPVRQYPLRHVSEPLVFVAGERQGQKVPPSGQPPQPHHPVPPFNAQAMLAQQNSNMEALERRAREQRGRERSGSMGQVWFQYTFASNVLM